MVDGRPQQPPGRMQRQIFHERVEVEATSGDDAPNSGNGFAFGGGPSPMVGCFFGAMAFWRGI